MDHSSPKPVPVTPKWMQLILRLAGIYNLAWGLWVITAPAWSYSASGFPQPVNLPVWQCLGMVIGVYGVGYWLAAADPVRHWPMIFVGLLGKVFGPLGFVICWQAGSLPLSAGRGLIFNDLIWWMPFLLILRHAARSPAGSRLTGNQEPIADEVLDTAYSQHGTTLRELSAQGQVLLVFLRHLGCTFCREALSDLQQQRGQLAERGIQIALVHMGPDDAAGRLFASYGLEQVPRFHDSEQRLYHAFGLGKGTFGQLLGPRVFGRGLAAAIFDGHGWGPIQGSVRQMPGVFLLRDGRILLSYRHRTAADRPDYQALACSLPAAAGTAVPCDDRSAGG